MPRADGIFVCYRRERDWALAGRLADTLSARFGADRVFIDVDRVRIGNWRAQVDKALDASAVLIVVISPSWLEELKKREGLKDQVVYEITEALRRGKQLLPVAVERAKAPDVEELPNEIRALADQQAYELGTDRMWRPTLETLLDDLSNVMIDFKGSSADPPLVEIETERQEVEKQSHREAEARDTWHRQTVFMGRGPERPVTERVLTHPRVAYHVDGDALVLAIKDELLVSASARSRNRLLDRELRRIASFCGSLMSENGISLCEIWRFMDADADSIDEARRLRSYAEAEEVATVQGTVIRVPAVSPNQYPSSALRTSARLRRPSRYALSLRARASSRCPRRAPPPKWWCLIPATSTPCPRTHRLTRA